MNLTSIVERRAKNMIFSDTKPVILYGAGNVGRDVLALLTTQGINVRCFMDAKDLTITEIDGIPIYKPNDPRFSDEFKNDTQVILSLFNAYVSVQSIIDNLTSHGWKNILSFLELHNTFPKELGRRFWLDDLDYYKDKEKFYTKASTIWADEKSRQVYESILNFRFSLDYSKLAEPDSNRQYFPQDVPKWNFPLRMIDCGAYDGDTLRDIVTQDLDVEKIAAFEPDIANFKKLAKEAKKFDGDITLFPCGAWSHCTQLRFASGGGSGSAISAGGDTVIQCVSIDEALSAFEPNLIKMDIEGAEHAALLGARRTIEKYRPGLAICLYHNPEHLWQIPLLIADWSLNYDFYLRCHCYSGFELVMYGVPR